MPAIACPHCDRELGSAAAFASHMRFVHPDKTRRATSMLSTTTTRTIRRKPRRTSRTGDFVCEVCDKHFEKEHGLRVHYRWMHGKRPRSKKAAKVSATSREAALQQMPELCYCPKCGSNLRLVAQALAAVQGLH